MKTLDAGIGRGFDRLSDRQGGATGSVTLLGTFYTETSGGGTFNIPSGTLVVEVIALGGGAGKASASVGGAGGGSVEYVFSPASDGLSIIYSVAAGVSTASDAVAGNNTTVTLPSGLGTMTALGGVGIGVGGSGTGPVGSVIRNGGNSASPGDGPFPGWGGTYGFAAGDTRFSGGGGAGPLGGRGAETLNAGTIPAQRGGGAVDSTYSSGSGALSIRCFGISP